jgi:hypothetical protein
MTTSGTPSTPLQGGGTPNLGGAIQPTNLANLNTPSSVVTQTTATTIQPTISIVDAGRNVKTIPFNGKAEEFGMWSTRFLGYLNLNNCKSTILGLNPIPPDAAILDPNDPADVLLINARSANNLAYLLLTMALTDAISHGVLYTAQTTLNPNGDSATAWRELNNIYKPTSKAKQYELEQEFNTCALTDESYNPDEWFTKLEKIKLQLKLDFGIHMLE